MESKIKMSKPIIAGGLIIGNKAKFVKIKLKHMLKSKTS